MSAMLLDTDVFSFIYKRDSRATQYAVLLADAQPCLSFQSVAELRLWALLRNWGANRVECLESSISRCLILPYDDATSRHWAEISAYRLQRGRPIACGDAWIAALALRHNLPLLSHNRDDFADIPGLVLLTPSQPDAP